MSVQNETLNAWWSNQSQGASQIYDRLLHPYLEQYEGDIDNSLEGMRVEAARRLQSLGASAASELAKAVTRQGFSAVRVNCVVDVDVDIVVSGGGGRRGSRLL